MINAVKREASSSTAAKEEPVKFSTSKAKTWDSVDSFVARGGGNEHPRLQPIIVGISTVVMFIYFTLLREPNEIDEMLSRPLDDVVPNVREQTLRAAIINYERMGLETKELKEALKQELEKKSKAALVAPPTSSK